MVSHCRYLSRYYIPRRAVEGESLSCLFLFFEINHLVIFLTIGNKIDLLQTTFFFLIVIGEIFFFPQQLFWLLHKLLIESLFCSQISMFAGGDSFCLQLTQFLARSLCSVCSLSASFHQLVLGISMCAAAEAVTIKCYLGAEYTCIVSTFTLAIAQS